MNKKKSGTKSIKIYYTTIHTTGVKQNYCSGGFPIELNNICQAKESFY